MSDSIKIVIADDMPLFREMLIHTLDDEEDITVLGEASDGEDAVNQCKQLAPNIIILDVEMPKMNGVEATRAIVASCPATRVVILTAYEDDDLILELVQAGATGYLVKDTPVDDVVKAIRVAHTGESLIQPRVAQKILKMMATMGQTSEKEPGNEIAEKLALLTSRELEVLTLIGRGLNNKEIADTLCIGGTTVKTHVTRIMSKLNLRDRVEAVLFAVQAGLVNPS
ncbi:MAG: response regulator transcription factor [Candidatus Eremiobacteraeota bacterium]|nr:response regulator transcription factor [Candidatus Eremiobacteraeota bacterium]